MPKQTSRRSPFATPSAQDIQTDAAQRAFNSFTRTIGRETTKANKRDLERRKAMANALPVFIDSLEKEQQEDVLAMLFYGLEVNATASDRRKIATHPLRPEAADDLHAQASAVQEANSPGNPAQDTSAVSSTERQAESGSAKSDTPTALEPDDDPFEKS